ncbi:MAG: hypothetical protein ABIQ16_13855 [Polyangiaceae bacterium]
MSGRATLPIALEFIGCDALDQRESIQLLVIEFLTLEVEPRAPLERVRIACGPSVARITIDDRSISNEVQFSATSASAWPRLLALSVSELVIESRAQVAPPPRSPQRTPLPPRSEAHVLTPAPGNVRLFGGFAAQRALRSGTWLLGPELGLEFGWTRHLSVVADARVELGSTDTDVAEVRWLSTQGALGVLIGVRRRPWQLGLGPAFALGYLRLSPTVSQLGASGHVLGGAWGGPQLLARAEYDFSARCFARLSVDSGLVVLPVTGRVDGDRRLVDAGGAWVSSSLGLGVMF